MKLGYSADLCDCLPEIECVIDASVEWDCGTPYLVVTDVLCSLGKASLMNAIDGLVSDIGYRIADIAEDDERLLARAVEEDVFEERAA